MSAELLHWHAPGPYAVAFTTRHGGVSQGAYASLNLGLKTDDDPANVKANRQEVVEQLGLDPERLALNVQQHGTRVLRAVAAQRSEPGDALWTDEPRLPLLVLAADCLPVALVRTDGSLAVAVVHAGWRGLLDGIVANAVQALGGTVAAAVGPAIGRSARASARTSSLRATSTCAPPRPARSPTRASRTSTTSTAARAATRRARSSRTAAIGE
jgi:copper oxidase (laccase) domain-containing protein